jgi:hypothetical protein
MRTEYCKYALHELPQYSEGILEPPSVVFSKINNTSWSGVFVLHLATVKYPAYRRCVYDSGIVEWCALLHFECAEVFLGHLQIRTSPHVQCCSSQCRENEGIVEGNSGDLVNISGSTSDYPKWPFEFRCQMFHVLIISQSVIQCKTKIFQIVHLCYVCIF